MCNFRDNNSWCSAYNAWWEVFTSSGFRQRWALAFFFWLIVLALRRDLIYWPPPYETWSLADGVIPWGLGAFIPDLKPSIANLLLTSILLLEYWYNCCADGGVASCVDVLQITQAAISMVKYSIPDATVACLEYLFSRIKWSVLSFSLY